MRRENFFWEKKQKSKTKLALLLICLLIIQLLGLFFLVAEAQATTYYVDCVSGNNTYVGTSEGQAWKTLVKVMSTLTGDQHDNSVLLKKGCTFKNEFDLPGSGTSGHPFTYGAYGSGANPIVDGTGQAHAIAAYATNHDIIIDSIDTYGGSDTGMIFYDAGVKDITIRNLTTSHAAASGIYVGVDNVTIQNVTVHTNGSSDQDHGIYCGSGGGTNGAANNCVMDSIKAYNNTGFGLQLWDAVSGEIKNSIVYANGTSGPGGIALGTYGANAQTLTARNNIIYDQAYNSGFYIYGFRSGSVIKIYNNTIYGNEGGIRDDGDQAGTTAISVRNNIFYNNTGTYPEMQITSHGTSDYNIFYPHSSNTLIEWNGTAYTNAQWSTYKMTTSQDSHSSNTNPLLANTGADNYTLTSSSPAINTGVNLGASYQLCLDPDSNWPAAVTTLNQNSYGSGWEMGAYVYEESSPPEEPGDNNNNNDNSNSNTNSGTDNIVINNSGSGTVTDSNGNQLTTNNPRLRYTTVKGTRKKIIFAINGLGLVKKKNVRIRIGGKLTKIISLKKSGSTTRITARLKYGKWRRGFYHLAMSYKKTSLRVLRTYYLNANYILEIY